ncbi:MAG: SagB family peptide dehydrogenase [Thermomicrobiales bacterium]|nr:SagB family peptide dehydrogenase [Thermomicrobiales bacterium]
MGIPPQLGPAMGEQDPALEPFPFKRYLGLDPVPLPAEPLHTNLPALTSIAAPDMASGSAPIDRAQLGTLLLRTAGMLKEWTNSSGKTWQFRAAGCTGARYHLELYAVTGDLDGLAAGVYHYDPQSHGLQQLRSGDFRSTLIEATGEHAETLAAPVLLVCTSEFWRNAWRYQERAYRHAWWDLGTQLTNLLSLSASMSMQATVLTGFVDDAVNHLVGADGEKEAALAVVAIGRGEEPESATEPLDPLHHEVTPSSVREIAFPGIQLMHNATALTHQSKVSQWRENPLRRSLPEPRGELFPLTPLEQDAVPGENVEEVILRRRSNRKYAVDTPLPYDLFSTVLATGSAPVPLDAVDASVTSLADLYLIVNAVEGLAPGKYVLHRDRQAIELLESGSFRQEAAFLACGQEYAADAHVNVYLLADLDPILDHYGDRGYGLAQLEGAITCGRVQLAAHALRLGAVGSTSADGDVTAFFSPHAAGKSFLSVAVFGVRRPKPVAQE